MKSLSFVFKNIKTFFLHHPVMFLFLTAVQIICCIGVFIVCGMANNMYYIDDKDDEKWSYDQHNISILFEKEVNYAAIDERDENRNVTDSYYTIMDSETGEPLKDENGKVTKIYQLKHDDCIFVNEVKPKIEELVSFLQDDFTNVLLMMYPNYISDISDKTTPMEITSFISGSSEEYGSFYENSSENVFRSTNRSGKYKVGDILTINGVDYSFVGNGNTWCDIPYNALQDEFMLRCISILLDEVPTADRINSITQKVNELFGDQIQGRIITPEPYDPLEQQLNQMVYVISLVVMVIILLAIAKFYSYILADRRHSLTVLRLCGSTRGRVHLIYMIEILLTMLVTSAIGFVIFRFVLLEPIASLYPSFEDFFTTNIYITILAAYIILALIIMAFTVIPSTKASIVDMKRGQ